MASGGRITTDGKGIVKVANCIQGGIIHCRPLLHRNTRPGRSEHISQTKEQGYMEKNWPNRDADVAAGDGHSLATT
eukprot:830443-Amphidinium_carterae.1